MLREQDMLIAMDFTASVTCQVSGTTRESCMRGWRVAGDPWTKGVHLLLIINIQLIN